MNRLLKLGLIGSIATALCCFTPLLVILLSALGVAAIIPHLDFVLLPLLGAFLLMLVVGLFRQIKVGS